MPEPGDPDRSVSRLVRLQPRAGFIQRGKAARYIGVSSRRWRLLGLLGAAPVAARDGRYPIEGLDAYVDGLYRRAGIARTEQARHRAILRETGQHGADALAFIRLATLRDLVVQSAFLALKAMILGGVILMILSCTPLLRTHF